MNLRTTYLRYKFWINDFINGSPIRTPYNEIKFIAENSYDKGEKIREKKLKKLLQFAQKNCKFYKDITTTRLSDFPVMNKMLYKENYDMIRVDENLIPQQKGKLHIQRTSGSTGTPFAIPQDSQKRNRRIAELKYFGKIVGFKTHDALIHLRTWNNWQQKTKAQIRRENIYPFDISDMSDEKMNDLYNLIKETKAKCLRGYASSFDKLCNYLIKNNKTISGIKICIAGSEALQDDVRAKVKKLLNCEIISQYANEECGILAQEQIPTNSTNNVMYLNNAGYYFEILKLETDEPAKYDELGRIVVTDLHNYAFPVIRYDTGDIGQISSPNKNSNGYPILSKLYGRKLDICYTTSGEPFHPMAIGRILKHFDDIIQWQFIQKDETEYTLKVIMKEDIEYTQYLKTAIKYIKEVIGEDAIINKEYVKEIPVLSSGKHKSVVNEWKNG